MPSKYFSYTGLGSQYAQALKDYEDEQTGITRWEQFLKPATQAYEANSQLINEQKLNTISQAYSAFRQSMGALNNSNIAQGQIGAVNRQAVDAFNNQRSQAEYTAMINQAEIESDYLAQQEALNKQFADSGAMLEALDRAVLEYASQITNPDEVVDLDKLYSLSDGYYTLTDYGRSVYDKVFHSDKDLRTGTVNPRAFEQFLAAKDPELASFYVNNKGDVNELIAGLDRNDMSYSDSDYTDVITDRALNSLGTDRSQIIGSVDGNQNYTVDYFDSTSNVSYTTDYYTISNKNTGEKQLYYIYGDNIDSDILKQLKKINPKTEQNKPIVIEINNTKYIRVNDSGDSETGGWAILKPTDEYSYNSAKKSENTSLKIRKNLEKFGIKVKRD